MTDCSVCCEKYTKAKRCKSTCPECDFECCRNCIRTFIMSQDEKHCMNCSRKWSDETLYKIVLKSWCKKHLTQKDTKFERHRAQFANVMPIVEYIQSIVNFNEQPEVEYPTIEYIHMKNSREQMKYFINQLHEHAFDEDFDVERIDEEFISKRICNLRNFYSMRKKYTEYQKEFDRKEEIYHDYERKKRYYNNTGGDVRKLFKLYEKGQLTIPNHTNNTYIINCFKDGCKGMVDNKGKCAICESVFCIKCFKDKNDDHECLEDDLETARMILEDTRPCPDCSTRISKIDGCDQMWCTICHTVFSWVTGKKQTRGHIHNPHFLEHTRERGMMIRDVGDHVCGGLPTREEFHNYVQYNIMPHDIITEDNLYEHYDIFSLFMNRFLQNKRRELRDYANNDIEYCAYLLNITSKSLMMSRIDKKEKKRQLLMDALSVYEMFGEFIIDTFRDFVMKFNNETTNEYYMETLNNFFKRIQDGKMLFSTELKQTTYKYEASLKKDCERIIRNFDANTVCQDYDV
jgi:hypothetical protein